MKSTMSLMKEHAAEGIRAAQEATAKNVEKGNAMGDVLHTSIADIAASNFISTIETGLVFIPQEGPEVSFSDPSVEIEYTPDNLEFNWEISSPEFNYVPYDINVSVEQYPRVDIEYVGEPNYFPQNPNLLEAQLEEFKEEANSDEE
ncbi:MAG: hypothetical protein K0R90_925 [Oscillospiraceae bacterium]|nr:hypothetical protein [Oscillospiraceae bacterium]